MNPNDERQFHLDRAWATFQWNGEWTRKNPKQPAFREEGMRAALWRLMVGSHAK